ncbi:hypothetical protein, partial [Ralstonia insidiosa]|uniref:hypothetical protein n=1 Tax=Ralstonia insidiosa TaxID=190721 RepID=UPI001427CFAD
MATTQKRFHIHREHCDRCDNDCNCPDTYYLEVNGLKGHGSASAVYDIKLQREVIDCQFLGWHFTADNDEQMVKQLERRINEVRDEPVTVSL